MKNNTVGNNLRRMREGLNLTQEELALRCDLTQGYINFLENGKRGYTKKSLAKIAKALGIHISQLFFEEKKIRDYVAEPPATYGKRSNMYDEIIALLDKLPDNVAEHYRMLLRAEVRIKDKEKGR
ncbi:MAG: helix-turn-helix transcriptional regulator [Deltaproteobacteria bacterium]|nr:helix-turn-helix transcriptional regulator [Deltaproteobacteria bacterium]